MLVLNAKFERFEKLATFLDEPEKLNKLEQLLENCEVDDLIEAVKLYRENLQYFQDHSSMSQSFQGMNFGRTPKPQVLETEQVAEITEEEEESSAQKAIDIDDDDENINRPVEAEEMKGDDDDVYLSEKLS